MSELIHISDKWKKDADMLLAQTGVIEDLKKYGEVHFSGAYSGNVMMHGDVDITVVRKTPYASEEVLEILRDFYFKGKFRSYFIKGDWDDDRKGEEFPHGHYIGMKQRLNGEKWKVDVWFVDQTDFEVRKKEYLDISLIKLTSEQRETILDIKKYRNDNNLKIPGQEIYEAVINKGIKNLEEFKQLYNAQK